MPIHSPRASLRRARRPPRAMLAAVALAAAAFVSAPATAQDLDSIAGVRPAWLRVCAGGDVTLGNNLDTTWVRSASARLGRRVPALPSPDSLLAPLAPLLEDADVVLLNVESAIGSGPPLRHKCVHGSTACFAFRAPPEAAGALRRVATRAAVVGNLANNHARDDGWEGLLVTQRLLTAAGVAVTGIDTLATPVVTAAGDTVAFLGFSPWTGPDPRDLAAVRRHVARAAAAYPRLVVTMHMGAEGVGAQRTRDAVETYFGEDRGNSVRFARTAVDAGAGLVVGHGPHVMRGVEWHGRGLVFYSLGNLATYGPFSLREPLNRGAVACALLDRGGRVLTAELRSTRLRPPGHVAPDPTGRAAALADSLGRLDFPRTVARVDAATGRVREPAP
jgi:poly-gamma-glutamate capsule biosynthesis protein CapA/YwtB (metallophosphatase superfamily)